MTELKRNYLPESIERKLKRLNKSGKRGEITKEIHWIMEMLNVSEQAAWSWYCQRRNPHIYSYNFKALPKLYKKSYKTFYVFGS